jgi:uncharacterized membrane protein
MRSGNGWPLRMGTRAPHQLGLSEINSRGDIVGSYVAGGVNHGYFLSHGVFTTIDPPGATSTFALGINPQGDVVGGYTAGSISRGFVLRRGAFIDIDFPGATSTGAGGINPDGDIVGTYVAGGVTHGFVAQRERTAADLPVQGEK